MDTPDSRAFVDIWRLGGCLLRVREAERERWAEEAQTRDDGASCWLNAFAVLLKPGCTHCHCGSFSRVFMMIPLSSSCFVRMGISALISPKG